MSRYFHRAHRDASSEAHASGEALRADDADEDRGSARLIPARQLLQRGVARSNITSMPVKRRRVIHAVHSRHFQYIWRAEILIPRFPGSAARRWIRLNEKSDEVCGGFRKLGLRRTVICGCRALSRRFVAESIKALVLTMVSSAVEPSMTSLGSVHKPIKKFPPLRWT